MKKEEDENTINGEELVDFDFVLSYFVKTGEISLHSVIQDTGDYTHSPTRSKTNA